MLTSFTSTQVEQLRRDAQRLRKQEPLSHNEALDRVAAKHGYRNWSLLVKHSTTRTAAPAPAAPSTVARPPTPPELPTTKETSDLRHRYYLHGDQDEGNSARYFCAQCDAFCDGAHFSSHGPHTGERFLERLERWAKRDARSHATWRRPDDAPNVLQADALAARTEYQAARHAFSDWLWAQRGEKHRTGLMARGLMTARGLPKTPKSLSQLVRHYELSGKQYFSPNHLFEAWADFIQQRAPTA